MLLNKIKKTKNQFRAYPTHQAVQTSGSTAESPARKEADNSQPIRIMQRMQSVKISL